MFNSLVVGRSKDRVNWSTTGYWTDPEHLEDEPIDSRVLLERAKIDDGHQSREDIQWLSREIVVKVAKEGLYSLWGTCWCWLDFRPVGSAELGEALSIGHSSVDSYDRREVFSSKKWFEAVRSGLVSSRLGPQSRSSAAGAVDIYLSDLKTRESSRCSIKPGHRLLSTKQNRIHPFDSRPIDVGIALGHLQLRWSTETGLWMVKTSDQATLITAGR